LLPIDEEEPMALLSVSFSGESLPKACGMNVVIPEGIDGPFPVLYLLHGLTDDYTMWQRRTSVERYADAAGLMIVMPDGHRSFYCNDPRPWGYAYEDHIVKDVVGFVDKTFPTIADRSGRAIGGLSMGGYGSMMLALRHADIFSAVSSHSSAFYFAHQALDRVVGIDDFAAALPAGEYDVFSLAERLKASGDALAIRIDCGTEDGLIESNREFHTHLDALGIAHEYVEHPGEHNWAYWDEHVQETIAFVAKQLKGE